MYSPIINKVKASALIISNADYNKNKNQDCDIKQMRLEKSIAQTYFKDITLTPVKKVIEE